MNTYNSKRKINEIYQSRDALKMKVASTMLETFLFYSGFFTPFYYLGNKQACKRG